MARALIAIYVVLVVWLVAGVWRLTRRRGKLVTPGTAMLASMDALFDDDRRAAVEVIIEERTGERDPGDKDGHLPDLENPPANASRTKDQGRGTDQEPRP